MRAALTLWPVGRRFGFREISSCRTNHLNRDAEEIHEKADKNSITPENLYSFE